jgi:antitoxin VapB
MATTRPFRSGNSQAVRIPAELAYDDLNIELNVTRQGDTLVISPARTSLKDMVDRLRALPKPPEVELYQPIEMPERE